MMSTHIAPGGGGPEAAAPESCLPPGIKGPSLDPLSRPRDNAWMIQDLALGAIRTKLAALARDVGRARRLSPAQRSVVVEALVLIPVVSLALRVVGLARTLRMCDRYCGLVNARRTAGNLTAHECARLSARVAALPVLRARCLVRTFVLSLILARWRIASVICIGVAFAPPSRRFGAHAWLEIDGTPVNDREDVRLQYHILHSFPLGQRLQPAACQ